MNLERLRSIEQGGELTVDEVYEQIAAAASVLNDSDRASDMALETAIRLLDALRKELAPESTAEVISMLAEECGLFPYAEFEGRAVIDQVVLQTHKIKLDQEIVLHAKQMEVLLSLLDGENVILSGPTSFGKSLILDAFISKSDAKTVAAILPTLALIDETRRRISKNFPHFQVVTTVSEEFDPKRPVFFALTQERFLQRRDIDDLDLLFIDEFYNLDQGRDDSRFEILNLALYRAIPRSKQIFMAGPHISGITLGRRWRGRFKFIATDYRTVAVNLFDRSDAVNRDVSFVSDLKSVGGASSLVFAASPPSAQRLGTMISEAGISYESEESKAVSEWLRENYHENWGLADFVQIGIGIHHGRVPRAIGQLFVKLFDAGIIKVLICTSTLIEGVNTSAANVFIYDKQINKTDFDFFSFANIRGRVGRMMRHFVGNAFLYHPAPEEVDTDIDIPILSPEGPQSDFLLINVEDADLEAHGLDAKNEAINRLDLPLELLRAHSYLGLDLIEEIDELIKADLKARSRLIWAGFPDQAEMIAVAKYAIIIARRRRQSTGLYTDKQVAWAWGMLMNSKSLHDFIRWFVVTFDDGQADDGIDRCFQFLQASEFSFPRALSICEAIVNARAETGQANYGRFIFELEHWFRPPWMKTLDEMGIPMPLSERFAAEIKADASKSEAISRMRHLNGIESLVGVDAQFYRLAFEYGAAPVLEANGK